MYDSPMHDMGYDVSDYENVLPAYGTVEDVERLIDACHERGMKLILDLVINHTSDQHKWFQESRSSKDSDKRDWYFWRPPRYDEQGNRLPPTNYRGYFAGSTCTYFFPQGSETNHKLTNFQGHGTNILRSITSIYTPKSNLTSTGTTRLHERQFMTVQSASGWTRGLMDSASIPSTSTASTRTFQMRRLLIPKAISSRQSRCGATDLVSMNSCERCMTMLCSLTGTW